jgi:uncharacterized membrane protein YdbT with pleckstrin-like domain
MQPFGGGGQRASRWTEALKHAYHRFVVPDFREHRLYNERTQKWEVVKYGERRHVIYLLVESWEALLIATAAVIVVLMLPPGPGQWVGAAVTIVAQVYFLAKLVDWSVTRFFVTDYRLVELGGFLDLRLNEIPKTKLTDIQLRQSLLGKLLGYGTIRVETAGQQQALNRIDYVRLPQVLNRELSSHSLT